MEMTTTPLRFADVTFGNVVSAGWRLFKKDWLLWVGITLLGNGLSVVLEIDEVTAALGDMSIVVSLFVLVVSLIVSVGSVHLSIKTARGENIFFSDLFEKVYRIFHFILAHLVVGLIVLFGFLFFLIPGIYFSLKYFFVTMLIVDKKIGIFEAMKMSSAMTNGQKIWLIWYQLGIFGLNILGFLALGVGLIVTFAMTIIAYGVLYLAFLEKVENSEQVGQVEPQPQPQPQNQPQPQPVVASQQYVDQAQPPVSQ